MSQLFVLSFDSFASPALSILREKQASTRSPYFYGWGVAWYPRSEDAAVVIKDSISGAEKKLTQAMHTWQAFQSTIFLGYIRGAAKGRAQQETQPFRRTYARRDWIFSHLGDLGDLQYAQHLPLGQHPAFEPMSRVDSEYIFCWLLSQIDQKKARGLSDFGFEALYQLFKKINTFGQSAFVLSDGEDLIIYQDQKNHQPLFLTRIKPPIPKATLNLGDAQLSLGEHLDANRTVMIVSTQTDKIHAWRPLNKSQMLVLRRGQIIWDTHADTPCVDLRRMNPMPEDRKTPQRLSVYHKTVYRYKQLVTLSKHYLKLQPKQDRTQNIIDASLNISIEHKLDHFEDVFGNRVICVRPTKPFTELSIEMQSEVSVKSNGLSHFTAVNPRKQLPLVWMPWQRQMMSTYLLPPELPESELLELYDFAMSFVERNDSDILGILFDINKTIYNDFEYASGSTHLYTTPYEVYVHHKGVCQDFANLFICLARLLSIPSRYRVGYIYTGGQYQNKIQSDASHAWIEVYLPWIGWVGFDPTNGCLADQDHIRMACGRNFYDATPTAGTIYQGGGDEILEIQVQVKKP